MNTFFFNCFCIIFYWRISNLVSRISHCFNYKSFEKRLCCKNCKHIFSGYRSLFIFFLFGIHLECPPGSYGKNCLQNCSEKCSTSRKCDRRTGACDGGCKEGWKPPLCDAGIYNTVIIIMILILNNYFWNKYLIVFKIKRIYNFQLMH